MILRAIHTTMYRKIRITFLTALLSGMLTNGSAQQVSISNNLLYDAWLTPNMQIGVRLSDQWSAALTAAYRPWPSDDNATRKYRHLLLSPEMRYWTDSVGSRHFFGANLIYSHYNVGGITSPFGLYPTVRDERREGDMGALGVFYGYSWPLGRHWNIEAVIGVAVGYTRFDRFPCEHCGQKLSTDNKIFAMPQAAVNIVYTIPGRAAKMRPETIEPVEIQTQAGTFVPVVRALPDADAKTINEACELLTTDCSDCHHEALRLLLITADDPRAQNALGAAYWLCGQQEPALSCFRRAAAAGDAAARENLRQLGSSLALNETK